MIARALLFMLIGGVATAGTVKHAQPDNYRRMPGTLAPGDTLVLAAGVYERGLPVSDCRGAPDTWITIQGPDSGVAEIRQTQVANCVELRQCSYVALKRLTIQGGGSDGILGLFGISAQGGTKNVVHHILIEDCIIRDWNTSQQAVAENVTGSIADAAGHLVNSDLSRDAFDLCPRPGRCEGAPLDLAAFARETAFDADFNGVLKRDRRFRGAYATAGPNRGWRLQKALKP